MLKAQRTNNHGFTTVELIGVIVIVGTLASLAAPRLKKLVDRWRVREVTESMVSTLYFARSEAVKRGARVVIQKLPNTPGGCQLARYNQEWGCGWFVFVDNDENGKHKVDEEILRTIFISTNTDILHNSGASSIVVNRNGKMDGLNAKGFVISPAFEGISSPATKGICMSAGGRIKVVEDIPCAP